MTSFYSLAAQLDMISGYSFVPYTGWGVMVSQPLQELEARARAVWVVVFSLTAGGLVFAGALGWVLSDLVTRPVRRVERAAQAITGGDRSTRVIPSGHGPKELDSLTGYFNQMAEQLETDREDLAAALKEARSADQAKSEFLANVSHELRTPLNAIIGFSDFMKTEPYGSVGDNRYAGYIDDIQSAGHHLRDFINDIIDLSMAEAGNLSLPMKPVDVPDIVGSAVQMVSQ